MFTFSDYISMTIHTIIIGLIYTFFVYMYFELDYAIYTGFVIGVIYSFYMHCKEKTDLLNMNPFMVIYFTFPVILICSPLLGGVFKIIFNHPVGYYFGVALCVLISYGITIYLTSQLNTTEHSHDEQY